MCNQNTRNIMNRLLRQYILTWLLLLVGSSQLWAASPDFDPPAPPEPYMRYVVTVNSEHGYASGSGKYLEGEEVFISTSSYDRNYYFKCWLKDGEEYTTDQQFSYKVENKNVTFQAVYVYDPVPPDEPVTSNPYRLYLTTDKEGSCSFNRTSGEKTEAGSEVWLQAYASQGFRFVGWYQGDELVSKQQSFYYTMPAAHTTLCAKFVYDPDAPGEPSNPGQGDIDNNPSGILSPSVTSAPSSLSSTPTRIYTLSGQEVKEMKRGNIYIINHKKVAVK